MVTQRFNIQLTHASQQLKGWFIRHKASQKRVSPKSSPYYAWLKTLQKPGPKPRILPLWQTYMKTPEVKERIEQIFAERWPDAGMDDKYTLDFRAKIAQELLQLETDERRAELAKQAEEEWHEKMQKHESVLEGSVEGLASNDPDVQALYAYQLLFVFLVLIHLP